MIFHVIQGYQFGTILAGKLTFLLFKNYNLALKLFQTGNPGAIVVKDIIQLAKNILYQLNYTLIQGQTTVVCP